MIAETVAGIAAVKSASDVVGGLIKGLVSAEGAFDKATLKFRLSEVADLLHDAKTALYSKDDLIREKDERIRELEAQLKLEDELKFEKPFYYTYVGNQKDGPFCQQCRDNNKKLIRLMDNGDDHWSCRTCHNGYEGPSFKPHPIRNAGGGYDSESWMG